jgi:hypothetical protein
MKPSTRIAIVAATFSLALALALPAQAHDRHPQKQRKRIEQRHHRQQRQHQRAQHHSRHQDRRYRYDQNDRYDRFDVPHRIRDHHRSDYRSYYEGSAYFAPHRHRHSIYQFPVRVDHGWSYREHAYCGDELYLDHVGIEFHGRRFSVRIGH